MNFSSLLLEFLKTNGTATIIGFGTFYLNYINAELDKDSKSILPPGAEVAFKSDVSDHKKDFSQFIAEKNGIELIDAQIELKKQINYWNATLYKEEKLHLENIGNFFLNDHKINFIGLRTENISPDFYGLEEIQFAEIKNAPSKSKSYQFSKSALLVSAVVVIIAAISYLGITQPEVIFGKKSFQKDPPKTNIAAVKKDSLKTDSLKALQIVTDSLKSDSIDKAILPIPAPVKRWSSKNNSKNKWKKPRKRQNR